MDEVTQCPLHRTHDLPQRPKRPVISQASKGLFARDFEDLGFLIPWVAPVPTRFQPLPHILKEVKPDLEIKKHWETDGDEMEAARTEDEFDRNEQRKGMNLLRDRYAEMKGIQGMHKGVTKAKDPKIMRKTAEVDFGKGKNRLIAVKKPYEKVEISMTKSGKHSFKPSQTDRVLSHIHPGNMLSQTASSSALHKSLKQKKLVRQMSPRFREKQDQVTLTQTLKDLRRPPIKLRATALKTGSPGVSLSAEEQNTFISFNSSLEGWIGQKIRLKEDWNESPRTSPPRRTEGWSTNPSSETHSKATFCYF